MDEFLQTLCSWKEARHKNTCHTTLVMWNSRTGKTAYGNKAKGKFLGWKKYSISWLELESHIYTFVKHQTVYLKMGTFHFM